MLALQVYVGKVIQFVMTIISLISPEKGLLKAQALIISVILGIDAITDNNLEKIMPESISFRLRFNNFLLGIRNGLLLE